VVEAGGNRTVSVEALLLWRHPLSGDGSSPEFVPLAEESPLIVDVGRWVLQQTCAAAAVPLLTGMAS
jgi:EAL domain-containing protein (putative c-di-GMP-specific phosphodiesterase class I)